MCTYMETDHAKIRHKIFPVSPKSRNHIKPDVIKYPEYTKALNSFECQLTPCKKYLYALAHCFSQSLLQISA